MASGSAGSRGEVPFGAQAWALAHQRRLGNQGVIRALREAGLMRAAEPLATTKGTTTTFSPAAEGHPDRARIEAHEAVHVAQAEARGERPTGSRAALEAEAERGAEAVLAGREIEVGLAAPAGLSLGYPVGVHLPTEQERVVLAATDTIPNQDIIYEHFAHTLAYGFFDVEQLRAWGYGRPTLLQSFGIRVWRVEPRKLPPAELERIERMHGNSLVTVVAFEGSASALHWLDDTSPEGVGAFLLAVNLGTFAQQLDAIGTMDLVGHSLGGALAQYLALYYGRVRRCVTFQAPGVDAELGRGRRLPEPVSATHHRVVDDPVAMVGGRHLPGKNHLHRVDWELATPHTARPLASLGQLRARLRGRYTPVPGLVGGDAYVRTEERVHGRLAAAYRGPVPEQDPDVYPHTPLLESTPAFDGYWGMAEAVRHKLGSDQRSLDSLRDESSVVLREELANQVNAAASSDGERLHVNPEDMERYLWVWRWVLDRYREGHDKERIVSVLTKEEMLEGFVDPQFRERMLMELERLMATESGSGSR